MPTRDLDLVLDAWLAPGPNEMPDRLYQDVLDHIERVPQRRTSRLPMRFTTMTPSIRLAAAAVLLLALGVGAGPLLWATPSDLLGQPSPEVSDSVPAISLADSSLRHRWYRLPPAGADPGQSIVLQFSGADSMSIADGLGLNLWQRVSLPAPGRIDLALFAGLGGCSDAEAARYAWSLSPGGSKLTLASSDDPCPQRSAVLDGEFQRDLCADPTESCVGPLETDSYFSTQFLPGADGRARVGGLTFQATEFWANPGEQTAQYGLVPAADLATGDFSGAVAYNGIDVYARSVASEIAECGYGEEPGVGTSVADLLPWLQQRPGLEFVTAPAEIRLGEHPAWMMDLVMSDTWTEGCPAYDITDPTIALLTEGGPGEGYAWGVGLGVDGQPARMRLILVDLGDDLTASIWIGARTDAEFDAFVAQAMPVVESMRFPGFPAPEPAASPVVETGYEFVATGPLAGGRIGHSATLLPDGRVVVIGGYENLTAEIWDPVDGTWSPAGTLPGERQGHQAWLLLDGRVMVSGGNASGSEELQPPLIWDPATLTFSDAEEPIESYPAAETGTAADVRALNREGASWTTLPDGRVLVAGGRGPSVPTSTRGVSRSGPPLASAELWDPTTKQTTALPSMVVARVGHTATLLPGGRVLLVGSHAHGPEDATAEVFQPIQ